MGVKYNPFAGNLDIVDSPSGDFSDIDISGDLSLGTGTPTTTLQAVTPTANRTISFPDATGTVALVSGADGTVQYNEAGVLKGNSDFTVDPDWNDASVTFTGLKLNVTDTASAAGSKLVDIQSNGTSDVVIDSDGRLGLGTSNPGATLEVAGSARFFGGSGTDGLVVIGSTGASNDAVIIKYDNANDRLQFYNWGASAANQNTFVIDNANSRVGIGVTSPAVACDVVGQVRASTGILFGTDTAAANALDDYEEGTFTPAYEPETNSFTSITYQDQAGSYTKIGNRVFFQGRIRTSAITVGTASGSVDISGLPFPSVNNSANGRNAGSISLATGFGGDTPSALTVQVNATKISLYYRATSNSTTTSLDVSDLASGAASNHLWFSGCYTVA